MNAQAMEALERANEVRYEAARFRNEIRALPYPDGFLALGAALLDDEIPPAVGALPIERFLAAAHRLGPRKAQGILRKSRVIRRNARVRDLSPLERKRIAQNLAHGWAGP